jgi:single-strand DNA-binding protein
VEGQLKTRKWQDNDGIDRYTTEIVVQGFNTRLVMLDGARKNGESEPATEEEPANTEAGPEAADNPEMPF